MTDIHRTPIQTRQSITCERDGFVVLVIARTSSRSRYRKRVSAIPPPAPARELNEVCDASRSNAEATRENIDSDYFEEE